MQEKDYPSLYQSANRAAVDAQRWYLTAVKLYLSLLVIGAVILQFAPKSTTSAIIIAIVLLSTLALSIYQAFKRYDIIWYNGRAVAESVKTRTWRYVMRAEPYEHDDRFDLTAKQFTSDIKEILNENRELGQYLIDDCASDCISQKMCETRSLDREARKNFYRENRIDEQRKWYAKKAKWNNNQSLIWFSVMIGANASAVVLTFFRIARPDAEAFPIDILITLAASVLTWMQVKRFQDLSTSYNLTAHEITFVRQSFEYCKTDKEFSDFVKDAENAFSREHTQWVARKDK